jgi:lysophospholipase L1-like esterase
MIDFFKNEHIAFIDLSREFTSIDEEIFLENDNHPNPKGHKLIADNIYQYLVKNCF